MAQVTSLVLIFFPFFLAPKITACLLVIGSHGEKITVSSRGRVDWLQQPMWYGTI